MNKQELIEKIKKLPFVLLSERYISQNYVLELLEQLDEPEQVTIPQFVADWIEEVKPAYTLFAAMEYGNLKIDKWLDNNSNQETFALAWIFGYEVEGEKRYLVKAKGICEKNETLNCEKHSKEWLFSNSQENSLYRTKHTRKELEEAGFGEVFNSPLFEVEEVE